MLYVLPLSLLSPSPNALGIIRGASGKHIYLVEVHSMALQFGICIVIAFYGYNMLEVYGSHYLCTGLILCAIIIAYLSAQLALSGSLLWALLWARLSTEPGTGAHKINLNSRTDRADT